MVTPSRLRELRADSSRSKGWKYSDVRGCGTLRLWLKVGGPIMWGLAGQVIDKCILGAMKAIIEKSGNELHCTAQEPSGGCEDWMRGEEERLKAQVEDRTSR